MHPVLPALFPRRDWQRGRLLAGASMLVAGLAGTIAHGPHPSAGLGVAGAGILASAALAGARAPASARHLAYAVEALALTALVAATGGPASPLSVAFLVPVLGAALMAPAVVAWGTVVTTVTAYAALFLFDLAPTDTGAHEGAHVATGHGGMTEHFVGMLVAYVATAPAVAGALLHARRRTARADAARAEARAAQARTERLGSLATLAAGASHELATPLSTILVVARELERSQHDPEVRDDLALIRSEVQRCQSILEQLTGDAGQGMAESHTRVDLGDLVRQALPGDHLEITADRATVLLPQRLVSQALRRLVGNALDASPTGAIVRVEARSSAHAVTFTVTDRGSGMAPEVLERAAEPFFTTKPTGAGAGLGLFFVKSVATHLGGSLTLSSTVGAGTTATLTLPSTQSHP